MRCGVPAVLDLAVADSLLSSLARGAADPRTRLRVRLDFGLDVLMPMGWIEVSLVHVGS